VIPLPLPAAVVALLVGEATRQDARYGPFPPTVAGLRLAVAYLQDETGETQPAWRAGRPAGWEALRGEAPQAAAVAIRLVRSLDQEPTRP
jgi:hypothetical protein